MYIQTSSPTRLSVGRTDLRGSTSGAHVRLECWTCLGRSVWVLWERGARVELRHPSGSYQAPLFLNTKFIVFSTKFIVFSVKFIVCKHLRSLLDTVELAHGAAKCKEYHISD